MRLWRWILVWLVVAVLAAFAWHLLAADPGRVVISIRGWRLETTVPAAVALLLLLLLLLNAAWRLLRWPFGVFSRRQQRKSQQRLGQGLVALAEGRHGDAERELQRAARLPALQGPAMLTAADAAIRRGESARAHDALDQAGQSAPLAARVVRAKLLRTENRATEALALLSSEADSRRLPPGGWHELVLAALEAGDPQRALDALEPLQKSGAMNSRAFAALEARVVQAVLQVSPDSEHLAGTWSRLPKTLRRIPLAIDAYVRRAAELGASLAALDELESALRRDWNPLLLDTYGVLAVDPELRLKHAQAWLAANPDDPVLLLALGRIAVVLGQWELARGYLARSLQLSPSAAAWEVLGDALLGLQRTEEARNCYRNALAFGRGGRVWPVRDVIEAEQDDLGEPVPEQRDPLGIPRVP
ncbi:heme biosynthesis protein HemY [Frateuria aurantia]|uniref:Putative enzyme of heme biosynthesis n=1 Tax=Frateuria aurantia (strain ATCC 33424 / DSM 6220 / KCTC 2777 / LMG 1558 / NBRC 3245 / NCIMB 13370) TaxID=767434 RepID=H8L227_FRAAD|nr:heme biosynthesis HemY N-terminal domain-containing protein [Frateuria aurantia]AFC87284.1 putative enzyme of heme biosynthesis [Frateuria aurantia DSM 6220]